MPLYLCVDCGGSKTSAVLSDTAGNTVARALGGPSNFAYLGLEPFLAVVKETVEKLLRTCDPTILSTELPGYDPASTPLNLPAPADRPFFSAAWLGISGCDSPAAINTLTPPLGTLLGVRPRVANDTHLLAAPMTLYPEVSGAVAVVAGTGGIVVSFRDPKIAVQDKTESPEDGSVALEELGRVGGWGWILGDEGGGFHVGREAVRQVLEEADRASVKATSTEANSKLTGGKGLKNRILERFGVDDVYELLTVVHLPDPVAPPAPPLGASLTVLESKAELSPVHMPREKRLSSLSPLVFAAAFEDHDTLALNVLKTTSGALVDQICILLKSEDGDGEARTIRASDSILCLGGSLSGIDAYRALMLDALKEKGHVFRRVQVVDDAAAVGARALAVATRAQL